MGTVKQSFIQEQPAVPGKTKFEFGRFSTFDDTPKSLMVTADRESGTIVLWHLDSHLSKKPKAPHA